MNNTISPEGSIKFNLSSNSHAPSYTRTHSQINTQMITQFGGRIKKNIYIYIKEKL